MINALLLQKTPREIEMNLVNNLKTKRKKLKLTQLELAEKSGVSFGSIKRFENKYEIALSSLIRIAIALNCENEMFTLFTPQKNAIEDYLND